MTSFKPQLRTRFPPFGGSSFWTVFRHETVVVEGVRLHFVEGGSGAPILLLPGWPQSWYAWRHVMPLLCRSWPARHRA